VTEAFRTYDTGNIAIRQDSENDGRTIHGYAVRWGELTEVSGAAEYPGLMEGFERGAFAEALAQRGERPYPYLNEHEGMTVAGIHFAEDDIGLRYEGRLLDTQAARDYAATVPAGNDGVSLEVLLRGAKSKRQGNAIIHTYIPRIGALAGTYKPAYRSAAVALREDGGNMDGTTGVQEPTTAVVPVVTPADVITRDTVWAIAGEAASEALRSLQEGTALRTSAADPFAGYRTIGELYAAARETPKGDPLRRYAAVALAQRALDNTVFTAGANAGLASGNLVTQSVQRIVNAGRPAINAFGVRAIGDIAGLTLNWPYFDGTLTDFVGAQSAEKAEITSASLDVKLGSEALVTYAGGTDMSYQILRRGDPSVVEAWTQVVLAAWAALTDAAAVTEVETGTVTIDFAEALSAHDLTEFIANLVDASVTIQAASGRPAEFALMSSTAFAQYAKAAAAASTATVVSPDFTIAGLNLNIGGIRLIHDANVTAGKVIISNELAGAWYEDGPFVVSADDVTRLGRDYAFWSMGAFARFIPAAIIEAYDVTP
jgi:HK97 family phage prohead protease